MSMDVAILPCAGSGFRLLMQANHDNDHASFCIGGNPQNMQGIGGGNAQLQE